MKITRHRVAAALFAASFAASFAPFAASPAFAAGQADAPPPGAQQEPGDHRHGRGPGGPESDGGPGGFGEHGPGMHGDMMMRFHHLNLSEAQRDKLFAIRHAAEPEQREHMKAIRKAKDALAELARADRFDDAKASALSRELGQAMGAEALLRARTEARSLAVLSPEQREQLRRHRTPGPQVRPRAPQDAPDAQAPQRRP